MLNVIIPAAGLGKRFKEVGFELPKPLIDVLGKPMIAHVLEEYREGTITLLFRKEHLEEYPEKFSDLHEKFAFRVLKVPKVTEGAACTVLEAYNFINSDDELLITNSDQLVGQKSIENFIAFCREHNVDGGVMCFPNQSPKWSYAAIREDGTIERVVEKQVISPLATTGVYYFRRGQDFVRAATQMIVADDRVNGEFYVAPTYNYLIQEGMRILPFEIEESEMHGLGTPEDLQKFVEWKLQN